MSTTTEVWANWGLTPRVHPAWRAPVATERLAQVGLPSTRDEAWRNTSLKVALQAAYGAPTSAPLSVEERRAIDAVLADGAQRVAVVVDGRLEPALGRGVGLAAADAEVPVGGLAVNGDGYAALADVFAPEVSMLRVARADDGGLVQVVFVTRAAVPVVAHPRLWVGVEQGARVTLLETHVVVGAAASLTNALVELVVDADADVTHVVVDEVGGVGATRVRQTFVGVGSGATYRRHLTSLGGGGLVRDVVDARLDARASATVDTIQLVHAGDHIDHRLVLRHVGRDACTQHTTRGVVTAKGRAVVDSNVHVAREAGGASARQSMKHLLVSPDGDARARPRLEIEVDEVTASHGATVGQLDAAQLNYLRSRGVPEPTARQMLTEAFVAEVVDRAPSSVAALVRSKVQNVLPTRLGGGL
jgi:Fe-S cluster assembly protein SufD